MNRIAITRLDATHFDVTIPVMMSDGQWRRDAWCHLVGDQLVSDIDGSGIRTGGKLRVTLSPARLADVQALAIGASLGDSSTWAF